MAWCRADGSISSARVGELLITDGLERVNAEEAGPGDIIAVAGIPEITIGETLADPEDPRPLPVITVDEPSISMVIGTNTSPMAGEKGRRSRPGCSRDAWMPNSSATFRCGCFPPNVPTPGRCRAAANFSSRCWSR